VRQKDLTNIVYTLNDLITYDSMQIHPEIARGKHITSWTSTIHWVNAPKPPKKDVALWISFLDTHVRPFMTQDPTRWYQETSPTYYTIFVLETSSHHQYQITTGGYWHYLPKISR
jgi:hypothetical protein